MITIAVLGLGLTLVTGAVLAAQPKAKPAPVRARRTRR